MCHGRSGCRPGPWAGGRGGVADRACAASWHDSASWRQAARRTASRGAAWRCSLSAWAGGLPRCRAARCAPGGQAHWHGPSRAQRRGSAPRARTRTRRGSTGGGPAADARGLRRVAAATHPGRTPARGTRATAPARGASRASSVRVAQARRAAAAAHAPAPRARAPAPRARALETAEGGSPGQWARHTSAW